MELAVLVGPSPVMVCQEDPALGAEPAAQGVQVPLVVQAQGARGLLAQSQGKLPFIIKECLVSNTYISPGGNPEIWNEKPSGYYTPDEWDGMHRPAPPVPPTLEEARTAALAALATRRWQAETAGIRVNGLDIPTDRESQSLITGAVAGTLLDPAQTVRWINAAGDTEETAALSLARLDATGGSTAMTLESPDAGTIVAGNLSITGVNLSLGTGVDPTVAQQALAASKSMAINNNNLSLYHFPYSAKDPYSGGRAIWGISGVAFVAKASGVAKATGAVGGWHYSPAGEERGIIDRREVQLLPGAGEPDEKAMYKARINKIGLSTTGKLMIDDALTCRQSEDYLRFQHVSSTMNAISRQFYQLANQLKHSPDGLTYDGLERGMTEILSGYVSADALVKPRNPDEDGENPYTLTVAQREIDSWEVQWGCCVTGTSRRILGSPSLIR